MTVVMLSAGVGYGLYMSLFYINLIDVLGMELYPDAVGVISVINGITFATAGPLFGELPSWSENFLCVFQESSLREFFKNTIESENFFIQVFCTTVHVQNLRNS